MSWDTPFQPRNDDPRLQPHEPGSNSWLGFDEIEAIGSDPLDFERIADREDAAIDLAEVTCVDVACLDDVLQEHADSAVPAYSNQLFAWAARPTSATYLDAALQEGSDLRSFDELLRRAASIYWLDVYREALRALENRREKPSSGDHD